MDFLTDAGSITLQLAIVDGIIKDILAKTKTTHDDNERAHDVLNRRLGECLTHRIRLREMVKELNAMTAIVHVLHDKVNAPGDVTTPDRPYSPMARQPRPKARQVQVPPGVDPGEPEDTDTDTAMAPPSEDDASVEGNFYIHAIATATSPATFESDPRDLFHRQHPGNPNYKRRISDDDVTVTNVKKNKVESSFKPVPEYKYVSRWATPEAVRAARLSGRPIMYYDDEEEA